MRLRRAVKQAGGNRAVSDRTGIPLGTLNNYIAGTEMRLPAAVSLAEACGVSLEWLATGREVPQTAQEAAPEAAPARPPPLFASVDIDRLAMVLESVSDTFVKAGVRDSRRLVQMSLLIYDGLTDPDRLVRDLRPRSEKIAGETRDDC